jgi:O-antigen/teichoic acid export membrane protein
MLKIFKRILHQKNVEDSFLLRKSALALFHRSAGMVVQYLFILVIARLYGAKEQGSFTLTFTLLQLLAILAQLGLDNRLVRKIASNNLIEDKQKLSATYFQSLKLTLGSTVVWCLSTYALAPLIAGSIFSKPWLTEKIQVTALCLTPFVLIGLNSSSFRGMKNMAGYLLFRAGSGLLALIILISFYLSGAPLSAISSYTAACFFVCIISFYLWFRKSGVSYQNKLHDVSWKIVLHESIPLMLTGSVFFVLGWTDNLMLGIFRTEAEVGMYDVAFKISSLAAIVLLSINAIQAPIFAELFSKGETNKLQRHLFSTTKVMFYTSLPVTLACVFFPTILLNFFGSEFKTASLALIILAIGNFVNSITGSIGILLQMTGKQHQYNRIIMIAAVGSITMHILLIPRYGIVGAAISSSVAKIFQNVTSVIYAKRKLGLISFYFPGIEKFAKNKLIGN